ncbi:MAG: hypothetical protein KDB07_07485, partial [Planctomycetes bacterium]|nr:hypothetical protein [Planctomycetota bacterium]
ENWISLVVGAGPASHFELETANMLQLGRAMARSALARSESRGVHFRSDFPTPRRGKELCHVVYTESFGATWQGA